MSVNYLNYLKDWKANEKCLNRPAQRSPTWNFPGKQFIKNGKPNLEVVNLSSFTRCLQRLNGMFKYILRLHRGLKQSSSEFNFPSSLIILSTQGPTTTSDSWLCTVKQTVCISAPCLGYYSGSHYLVATDDLVNVGCYFLSHGFTLFFNYQAITENEQLISCGRTPIKQGLLGSRLIQQLCHGVSLVQLTNM